MYLPGTTVCRKFANSSSSRVNFDFKAAFSEIALFCELSNCWTFDLRVCSSFCNDCTTSGSVNSNLFSHAQRQTDNDKTKKDKDIKTTTANYSSWKEYMKTRDKSLSEGLFGSFLTLYELGFLSRPFTTWVFIKQWQYSAKHGEMQTIFTEDKNRKYKGTCFIVIHIWQQCINV